MTRGRVRGRRGRGIAQSRGRNGGGGDGPRVFVVANSRRGCHLRISRQSV